MTTDSYLVMARALPFDAEEQDRIIAATAAGGGDGLLTLDDVASIKAMLDAGTLARRALRAFMKVEQRGSQAWLDAAETLLLRVAPPGVVDATVEACDLLAEVRARFDALRAAEEITKGSAMTANIGRGVPMAGLPAERRRTGLMNERPEGRAAVIVAAREGFRAEIGRGRAVLCSERAWVNTALRDRGQMRLSDDEAAALGIESDRAAKPGVTPDSRETVIAAARLTYQREVDAGKQMLCDSERSFCNGFLIGLRLPRLSDEEARTLGIAGA